MANHPEHPEHPETGPEVTISIDNKTFKTHRGSRSVAELKAVGGVELAYEFEQIVDGQLVPLEDDGRVVLKGGERFVSHPRAGASS